MVARAQGINTGFKPVPRTHDIQWPGSTFRCHASQYQWDLRISTWDAVPSVIGLAAVIIGEAILKNLPQLWPEAAWRVAL